MTDQSLPHYVGLDIGTSTVRCIVGVSDPSGGNDNVSIVGYGSAATNGMRKGVVVYADDVAESIIGAVNEAERISGMRINAATVNVNGVHVNGINSKGVVAISAANRQINEDDRARVEDAATIVQLPPNREIVQLYAKNYRLDGQGNIKDPIGMQGVRLEVDTHIVTAATPSLRNLELALDKAQILTNRRTLSSLAAVESVLNRQQKESGTVLLDIGAGTTNLVVIEDGEVQHVAVLPLGGINITNDLAIGLKTDLDVAEQAKIQYARVDDKPGKENISVALNKTTYDFKASEIKMITEARVDEIFDYVEKELHKIQRSRKLPGGIVLVGGTAKLPGIAEFAKEKLQLAARVGQLHKLGGLVEAVNDPAAFSAVGLMLLDMLLAPNLTDPKLGSLSNTKILNSLTGFLKSWRR